MKLLYVPQASMRSYDDSMWLLNRDAQITKMFSYVRALPDGWSWDFVLPEHSTHPSVGSRLAWPRNVEIQLQHQGDNVLENRYHFNISSSRMILRTRKSDVVLLEIPEHARAWRVAMAREGLDIPIVSMVEHVDLYDETRIDERVRFMLRQIDGCLASDATAFPLPGMKHEWLDAARLALSGELFEDVATSRLPVWRAIFSPVEVESAVDADKLAEYREIAWEMPVVNIVSRLSDNKRTRHMELFEACRELGRRRQFEVWVQNPNDAMTDDEIRQQLPKHEALGALRIAPREQPRSEYIDSLWRSDIVPILYPQSHIYSVGCLEAIAAQNIIVTVQPERLGDDGPGLHLADGSVESIVHGLDAAMDIVEGRPSVTDGNLDYVLEAQRDWMMGRSIERNLDVVRGTIEDVVARA